MHRSSTVVHTIVINRYDGDNMSAALFIITKEHTTNISRGKMIPPNFGATVSHVRNVHKDKHMELLPLYIIDFHQTSDSPLSL